MKENKILSQFPRQEQFLLMALSALQESREDNSLSEKEMTEAARYFHIPTAQVFGLAGYYSMFSRKPRGRHLVRVCVSPVCRMIGSDDLLDLLSEILGVKAGETSIDGNVSLETCQCLGNCHKGPSLMIDEVIYGTESRNQVKSLVSKAIGSTSSREAEK
jgi:NADH:ubiquinone oxidoreductase subunit E